MRISVLSIEGGGASGHEGGGGGGKQQLSRAQHDQIANHTKELDKVREDPFAMLLSARVALENNERCVGNYSLRGCLALTV